MNPGGSRVLLVDDDPAIHEFIEIALCGEGHEVLYATNGAAALRLLMGTMPDVILLDMRMPVMDGWEFARRYRQARGPHAPIVVFTAATDAAKHAAEIQADGYLPKPFDLADLFAVVARFAGGT